MTTPTQTDLHSDLEARGIIKQVTDPALAGVLARERVTLYAGFDPTSDSLHVGSLLPLLTLRRFQLAGHRPIALVGGATGMIGDPSGKSQERSLLGETDIARNVEGIKTVLARFLDFEGSNAATLVNNGDWFQGVSYIQFLRDVGKHFTINHMMAKESVRARLEDREQGISYTEFSYMLLQAYDFHVLHQRHGCRLQIGGSDQWGNITAGIELIRRMAAREGGGEARAEAAVFGLTHPLVTKADGTKFGKTERGTVWLDAKRTSPYQFYQFLIRTADADVITYLRYFTFLSAEEMDGLVRSAQEEPEKQLAQRTLARELTRLVHGEAELGRAERASEALFGTAIRELDERTLLEVMSDAPSTTKDKSTLGSLTLVDALVETKLASSKGDARKSITSGGIYVNNERVGDAGAVIGAEQMIAGAHVVLRKGKKNYHLLRFA